MQKIKLSKGQVLHKKGDVVRTLEIVLSGALMLTDGNGVEVRMDSGTLAGAIYQPKDLYTFDIVAVEESVLVVMDYRSVDSIAEAVLDTPAIAPVMAAASMDFSKGLLDSLGANEEAATELCKELKYNHTNYSFLCVKLGKEPEKFSFIEALAMPAHSKMGSSWQAEACKAFCAQREELKKSFYTMDAGFCVTTVMQASETGRQLRTALEAATAFISWTKAGAADFVREYYDVKSRTETGGTGDVKASPAITNALSAILAFAGVSSEVADAFRKSLKQYNEVEDRRAKSDEMRTLRADIAKNFYTVYEAAFFKSLETSHIPVEVRMFFLFGFVDEVLAGEANTAELYNMAVRWEADPAGCIMPMYEWLVKIYKGEGIPSKNEFDNDWTGYLREAVRTSVMTQKQANELLDNKEEMIRFEIRNMFTSANRITNGRLASFVPVFCAQDVIRPLDKCLASPAAVQAALDKVTDIDFGCFYRPALAAYPDYKIPRFVYNLEVKPYIILMPNIGVRGVMWQEIEGANKVTPAHMVVSIFHVEELEETITRMCADFRWEMCRRIQGIRYADITDRSLTSEYIDYLQFYKKNGFLSNDMKEHIKLALQKARNDYKGVFVSDYTKYIQNEAFGLPRLNKIARDIIFRYCTLSKKFRASLAVNPQFGPLIDRWKQSQGAKLHGLSLLQQKMRRLKPEEEIPEEVKLESYFSQL